MKQERLHEPEAQLVIRQCLRVAVLWLRCSFFRTLGSFHLPRRAATDHARSGILHVLTSVGVMQYLLSSLATMVFIGILALLAQWSRKSRRAEISLLIVLVFLSLLLCVPTLLKIVRGRPNGDFWTDPPVFLALWLFATVLLANNLVGIIGFQQLNQVGAFSLGTAGRIPPVAILASQLPFVVIALLGVGAGIRRDARATLARLGYGSISLRQVGIVVLFIAAAFALSAAADALFSQLQP